jgi:putative transposon-encoded protein
MPDSSGNVFFEPQSIKATNDAWPQLVAVFNDTATRIGLGGRFTVPKNYVGTAKVAIVWSTTATSGDVEWDLDYRAVGGDDTESLDQSGTQESVNLNDTAPSAAHERMECLISLTSANFAVDDEVEFALYRDGTDSGDTIAAAVMLYQLLFEYADA